MVKQYQIKNKEGIVIGRFQNKIDRNTAFESYIKFGYKCEVEI